MRVVFLGPPGAGKGTQARELAREWGIAQLATGDILREAVARDTLLGRRARGFMEQGALVPDELIVELMTARLAQPDAQRGFILDGFPRTLPQAEALDRWLDGRGQRLDRVVYFEVSEDELLRRLTGRRMCPMCQATYHLVSTPPREPGVCDHCGASLVQRPDDREDTVRVRLKIYAEQTAPLLDYYRARGLLRVVAGEGTVEAVRAAVRRAVMTGAV